MITRFAVVFFFCAVAPSGRGDDLFRERVAPLLQTRCLSCHNDVDRQGGFSLQTGAALFESGYIAPGQVAGSHLLSVVTASDGETPSMPRDGRALTDAEVAWLRTWVAAGAPWPAGFSLEEPAIDNFDWWSFRSLTRPDVPTFEDGSWQAAWVRSPIDAFVLRKLHQHGLNPSPEATRRTLIRRLSYDLTGLPPTPRTIRAHSDGPLEGLVDKLLASPHYGERWARHWLDVVRYADTCGYDKDKLRPNGWPYRDYVIRSFNEDKPYSRFVQEQIAGDALFPGEGDGILGLGFIAAGPWDFIGHVEVPEEKIDGMIARNLDRDDMVSNTLNTFCSVTIQCARCHNHKFDPITQDHYYSLQSVFAAVDRADRIYGTDGGTNRVVYAAATDFRPQGNFQPTKGTPRVVRLLHRGNVQQPLAQVRPGTIPLGENDVWQFTLPEDHSEAERRAALARWVTRPDNPLTWRSIANRIWQYHFDRALVDSPNDFGRMGQQPTHPELLDWLAAEFRETQSFKHMHRLIVSSATWRQTSSVVPPPLADENVRVRHRADDQTAAPGGPLIRPSASFSSVGNKGRTRALDIDGGNRFLWRMNRRRLSAEEIRDSMLLVSGKLNRRLGGPGFYLFELEKAEHSPHYEYHKFDPADPASHRRSIYRFIVRSQPDPLMTTLDCADSSQSTPKRTETLTSLQALSLLNNRFVLTMSEAFADRLDQHKATMPDETAASGRSSEQALASGSWKPRPPLARADSRGHDGEQSALAFALTTGRQPTKAELQSLQSYAEEHGMGNLCRILFNLSEFVFVD